MMELTPEGKETLNQIGRLAQASPELGFRILKEMGADGLKESSKEAPKDTESLVSTGRLEIIKLLKTVRILFGGIMAKYSRKGKPRRFVNYAGYVHEGTYKKAPNPFLQRGLNRSLTKRYSIAKVAFNNWIFKFRK